MINKTLLKKLPKYAMTSEAGAAIDWLDVSKTSDGNHYTIMYTDGETWEEYGWANFLYCIKHKVQT